MIAIPLQISPTEFILILALQDENIDRIRQRDPAEFPVSKLGEPFASLRLRELHITYASAHDLRAIQAEVARQGDPRVLLKLLIRGWQYRPDQGDNDLPPYSMKGQN